jgi:endonuclease/exonuclease/phosphatase family metal-dependent hydrolase
MTCLEGTPGVTVQWIDAADESDSETNSIWCRSVGPWVVRDFSQGSTFDRIDTLAVVTWNVFIGGGDVVPFVEDLRRGIHTDGEAPRHFVLLLQEAYRDGPDVPRTMPEGVWVPTRREYDPPSGDRMDIIESAERLGLWLFYVPSQRNGWPEDGPAHEDKGNAILSTVPLNDLTAIDLPFEKYRRVAIAATAEGRSSNGEVWRLRICNVHLDNRASFPRFLQSAGAGRFRQTKALLPWLREVPCVLGGDFNTWAPETLETAIPLIRETFRQPEVLSEKPTCVAPFIPDRRVDFLFFNLADGLTAHYDRVENRYGSDHYPLLGWVQLVPAE